MSVARREGPCGRAALCPCRGRSRVTPAIRLYPEAMDRFRVRKSERCSIGGKGGWAIVGSARARSPPPVSPRASRAQWTVACAPQHQNLGAFDGLVAVATAPPMQQRRKLFATTKLNLNENLPRVDLEARLCGREARVVGVRRAFGCACGR